MPREYRSLGVDRAVHPAGLFRRHVGQRSGDYLGRFGVLTLARNAGGNAEAGEPDAAAFHVHQHISRFDVLMNKSSLMHLPERARERDRNAQKYCQFQRSTEQAVEGFTARVLEHQRQAVVVAGQCDWPRRPGSIQFGSERIFVFEPLEARKR
jgi:hypothetical protein